MKKWHDIVEIEKKYKVEEKNDKTDRLTTHMLVDKVHDIICVENNIINKT